MNKTRERPHILASFSKAQVSSGISTVLDFGLLFSMTEIFHVWYVISVATGAAVGAIANFMINRHWSFEASEGALHHQAWKYTVVSAISLLLNTSGVWAMTEYFKIHYSISVVTVSILVGLFFNFPLHHKFVFR